MNYLLLWRHHAPYKLLTLFLIVHTCIAFNCRVPEGAGAPKSPADGRFRITIFENPEKYIAGEKYTIILAGFPSAHSLNPFLGFALGVEMASPTYSTIDQVPGNAGQFGLTDRILTKFSEKCNNVVTSTSTAPKTYVNVTWEAPPAKSGCVVFMATIVERRDSWYMDDGPLHKIFCEDEQDYGENQLSIVEQCCACEEAQYELMFEGLWCRNTHPKDFPSNMHLTKFSDIVGASHSTDYRFWEYGQRASPGVQQMGEHGVSDTLEKELKQQHDQIRTIIKARGIGYPNLMGQTFSVFRVDSKHHLISLISQMDPSPDWVVGVSGLELCLPDCKGWVEHKEQNLYPWDLGTDSGPSYESADQPTVPHDTIRRIKSNMPNDPRSPFFDESGVEIKPIARIVLTRQRLYDTNCESNSNEEITSGEGNNCETGPWSPWSECNMKCGNGNRLRQRQFQNQLLAQRYACKTVLMQTEPCFGTAPSCDDNDTEQGGTPFVTQSSAEETAAECELTSWSQWSSCSAQCGRGTRTRTRNYLNKRAKKKCQAGAHRRLTPLEENEDCDGDNCAGDIDEETQIDYHPDCPTSQWSDWSPCSVTCGEGIRTRKRRLLYKNRSVLDNNMENNNDPCTKVKLSEEVSCNERSCDIALPPDFCALLPDFGECTDKNNDFKNQWFYDANTDDCAVFFYSGCNGNDNRFASRKQCLETCRIVYAPENLQIESLRKEVINTTEECVYEWTYESCNATCGNDGYREATRHIAQGHYRSQRNHELCQSGTSIEKCQGSCESIEMDCPYSQWTGWTPCTVTCGDGWKFNTRTLLDSNRKENCKDIVRKSRCHFLACPLLT